MNQHWQNESACKGCDPNIFFPDPKDFNSKITKLALSICESCNVRAECLAHAINNNEIFGIWGGKTERARKKIARSVPLKLTVERARTFL